MTRSCFCEHLPLLITGDLVLQEELEFFEANRSKWLTEHGGKYDLVKGKELIGTFDTAENAYVEGVKRYGNVAFLIKQILAKDPLTRIPALSLGLIRADL